MSRIQLLALQLQGVGVGLAEERLQLGRRGAVQLGELVGFVGPAGLAEEDVGIHGAGHGVQDAAVRGAEVAGDVAALLLGAGEGEGADLLEGGHKGVVEVFADLGTGQGVHTERLGVVSGEAGFFKVA